MEDLLLIDANSLIHRAYHALPPLTARDGSPAGALYGIARMLGKVFRDEKPRYVAACFDRPEPTFRDEEYKEYKAHRPETAQELVSQLIAAHDLFKALGIRTFDHPGFEADDCIATLAERFGNEESLRVVILTGDRDTLQLVRGDKVLVHAPKRGISDVIVYDENKVREEYSLSPRQIIDYKALAGDSSDNIKGVAGVGPKTAKILLSRYPSVEDILAHPDDALAAKVAAKEEDALRSKRLVTLRTDAPLGVSGLKDLEVREDSLEREAYFSNLGFKSLISAGDAAIGDEKPSRPPQGSMF